MTDPISKDDLTKLTDTYGVDLECLYTNRLGAKSDIPSCSYTSLSLILYASPSPMPGLICSQNGTNNSGPFFVFKTLVS